MSFIITDDFFKAALAANEEIINQLSAEKKALKAEIESRVYRCKGELPRFNKIDYYLTDRFYFQFVEKVFDAYAAEKAFKMGNVAGWPDEDLGEVAPVIMKFVDIIGLCLAWLDKYGVNNEQRLFALFEHYNQSEVHHENRF